jgi:hypothetical protein
MTRLAPLALVVPFLFLLAAPMASAEPVNRPSLLLHVGAVTGKNPCTAAPTTCDGLVTTGSVDSTVGAGHFLYVLARNAGPEGPTTLAGVQFGIDYDAPGPGEGLVVNSWTRCALMEFPMPTPAWPAPGGGNLLTWDYINDCQTGELVVVGFFYVTAYSPAVFELTPRPADARARTADCATIESEVYPDHLGWVSFGGATRDGDPDGGNPCLEATLPADPVAMFTRPLDGYTSSDRGLVAVWSGLDDTTPMEALEFSFRLDGGPWSPYSPGWRTTYSSLPSGGHTLELRVRDEDGIVTDPADSVSFTITAEGNQPPNVTIVSGPAEGSSIEGTAFHFAWSIDDEVLDVQQAEASWRFDGGPWSPWTTSRSTFIPGIPVGVHSFEVRARDIHGLVDETPAIRNFTTVPRSGNTPPTTTITTPAADGDTVYAHTPGTILRWQIDDDQPAELDFVLGSWRLDGGPWSAWSVQDQVSIANLAPGPHLLEVRARDLDGAEESPPAARQFIVVPNQPPDTYFTMGLADGDTVFSYSLWISFSGTDDGTPVSELTFALRRVPEPFSTVHRGGGRWVVPEVGWQTYEARARDEVGVVDPTPASITLYFDRREPEAEIFSGPLEGSQVQTAVFDIGGYDLVTPDAEVELSWRVDDGPWSPWVAGRRIVAPTMPLGLHRFEVRARDGDGIIDQTPDFRNFELVHGLPLPIAFADLKIDDLGGLTRLSWRVDADEPVVFHVHRAPAGAATRGDDLSGRLVPDARGAASFVDATAEPGRAYDYRIVAVGRTETVEHGPIRATAPGAALRLRVATPARAGEPLSIDLQMAGADGGRLELFDTAGRLLRVWALPAGEPGWRREQWDGRDAAGRPAPAGLYFLRLTAEGQSVTARVVRLR